MSAFMLDHEDAKKALKPAWKQTGGEGPIWEQARSKVKAHYGNDLMMTAAHSLDLESKQKHR